MVWPVEDHGYPGRYCHPSLRLGISFDRSVKPNGIGITWNCIHESRPWSGRRALLLNLKLGPNSVITKSVYSSVFRIIEINNHKVIPRLLLQSFIEMTKSLQLCFNSISDCGIAITWRTPWRIRLKYIGSEEFQWQPVIIRHAPTISKSFSKGA